MPSYFYKAKNDAAMTISGQLEAANQDDALEMIHQLGLIPVSINEGDAQGGAILDVGDVRIKPKEVYLFIKQLAALIKSGVSLLRALEVISVQSRNPHLARVVMDIAVGVKSGRSFSAVLSDYPNIFTALLIAMVRAGEEMGRLREMLSSVADYLKKQQEFAAKVRGALVYPALMFVVGVLTVVFILTFVMPKMAVIFTDSRQDLPIPTILVMAVSQFFQRFWIPVAFLMAIGLVTFGRWRKTPQGAWAIGAMLLKIAFVRDLVVKADLARFTNTMSLLLNGGLPIIRAIEVATPTVHNPQLRVDLLNCAQDLAAGENLGQALGKSTLMPSMLVQSITVGEEAGSLTEALGDIAESYESDIDEATRMITTILEPLMILGVGLVVGLIVFAMLLPIFSMDIMAR